MKRLLSSLFIIAGIAILVVAVAAWGKSPGEAPSRRQDDHGDRARDDRRDH